MHRDGLRGKSAAAARLRAPLRDRGLVEHRQRRPPAPARVGEAPASQLTDRPRSPPQRGNGRDRLGTAGRTQAHATVLEPLPDVVRDVASPVVLHCCLRFDGGMLLYVVACARIERTRRKCIGQETRRPFRLLFVATQSLRILWNIVHRVAKAAENRLRCRVVGTSPILLPQTRGMAPQKRRALRMWGRRRTLKERRGQRKKTFGGCASGHNTTAPLSPR